MNDIRIILYVAGVYVGVPSLKCPFPQVLLGWGASVMYDVILAGLLYLFSFHLMKCDEHLCSSQMCLFHASVWWYHLVILQLLWYDVIPKSSLILVAILLLSNLFMSRNYFGETYARVLNSRFINYNILYLSGGSYYILYPFSYLAFCLWNS